MLKLISGDSFEELKKIKTGTVDMIFVDPPYFLSNDGITCKSGKMVSVNKGSWDKVSDVNEKHRFNRKWIRLCKRVLKPNGSIWISGTLHNIYSIGMALEQEGFKIINNITWQKTNPPPNLACSRLSSDGKSTKRFDFVVKTENTVYGIETNFYTGGGSKLNETARSYELLSQHAKDIDGFVFVWFTDGIGWNNAKGNLRETFEVMQHVYNIADMEQNIMKTLFA